ncbi:MAG: FAD:protein FMN transferase [Planctomycetia bacterium]|nr:FAD:protein FMN transferase [Planctomycetia bacterium]
MAGWLLTLCMIAAPPPAQPVNQSPAVAAQEAGQLTRFEYQQVHMGSLFKIVFYAAQRSVANDAARAAFARINAINQALSDYDPQSELCRLSAGSPSPKPVPVSADLWSVLRQSQQLAERSDGAFDVTVGPLTTLWRRSRRERKLPTTQELAAARAAVGYGLLKLDPSHKTAQLLKPNMRLDLGGIAKGFAADEAQRVLTAHGITRALVAASGDIAVADPPPDAAGWKIALAPLRADDGTELSPARMLVLSHKGISTSGDGEQHVVIDGTRYSHIVEPHTGLGLPTISSVTIVAPNCTTSDAMATAVDVLGPKKGIALVESTPGVEGIFVLRRKNNSETIMSRGFAALPTK